MVSWQKQGFLLPSACHGLRLSHQHRVTGLRILFQALRDHGEHFVIIETEPCWKVLEGQIFVTPYLIAASIPICLQFFHV
jgi:hypothetical protein